MKIRRTLGAVLLSGVMSLILCAFPVLLCVLSISDWIANGPPDPCADETFVNFITANADTWMNDFQATQLERDYHRIALNNDRYIVALERTREDIPYLYISVYSGWPGTPIGVKGFIYTENTEVLETDWDWLEIRPLAENVYCYTLVDE